VKAPVIETPRLCLTLLPPSAARRMVAYYTDNLEHFAPFDPPRPSDFFTEEYWARRLGKNIEEAAQGGALRLEMVPRDDRNGPVVGVVNFTQIFRGPLLACVLGFSLDQASVGRGLMQEGAGAAIRHVFDVLGLHRIEANHLPTNERSARLLARLGFVVEGYAKEYLFIDGAWRDHVRTALTNPRIVRP
jgi:ribosomal-protein-alanine N-acetyltransferase